ncbi:SLAC1 family transporter [Mycoplasma sp. HF14]
MKNLREKLIKTPLGVNGVALGTMGIATTGTFLLSYVNTNPSVNWFGLALQILCMSICLFYISLTIIRYCLQPKVIWDEISKPHVAGMIGVLFLCFCLLGNSTGWIVTTFVTNNPSLKYYLLIAPSIVVFLAVTCQFIYLGFFLKIVLFKKETFKGEAYASWFVPLVGLAISAAYADNLGDVLPLWYWQGIWFVGFVIFIIMYPFVFYKFLFKPHSNQENIPSMAIFASPANMLAVGYLVSFNPHRTDIYGLSQTVLNNQMFFQIISIILFCFGTVSVALYYAILVKSLKLRKYSMTWTSLTFPAAVSATGTIKFAEYFFNNSTNKYSYSGVYWVLFAFGVFLFLTSLALVLFCNYKYACIMYSIWFIEPADSNKKESRIRKESKRFFTKNFNRNRINHQH